MLTERTAPADLRPRTFDVPLPAALHHIAPSTRATLVGPVDAPLLLMLGGISGDRFPALREDGGAGWWSGLAQALSGYRLLGFDFIADATGAAAPTPREQALALSCALDAAGIPAAHGVIGASYGGMVALALAEHQPERLGRLVILCADAAPHPIATAARELQRRVVRMGLDTGQGEEALAIARGMAMLTYRTPAEFAARFNGGIDAPDPLTTSAPGAYLRARGAAYRHVMSPARFLSLSASIDRHRVDPGRIAQPTLLIGSISDQLVPPAKIKALAAALTGSCELHLLDSLFGHDMFLKDTDRVAPLVRAFVDRA